MCNKKQSGCEGGKSVQGGYVPPKAPAEKGVKKGYVPPKKPRPPAK